MRILRVFGLSKAEMNSIIENAQAEGSPSLRLQERDGEYLVCVQASAPTQAMADEYCEKWVQKLRTRFGDACYGFEDTTLAQAALDAGMDEICFTDHVEPLTWGSNELRPPYDWSGLTADFANVQAALGDRIHLRLGMEMGDAQKAPAHMKKLLEDAPQFDFIIGSVHLLSERFGSEDLYLYTPKDQAEAQTALGDYLEEVLALAKLGGFTVLGHLTLPLRYFNEMRGLHTSFDPYEAEIREILKTLIENGRGIELNVNRGNTPLPDAKWLRIYRELGGELITLGTDAHSPEHVGRFIRERQALLKECGFTRFCTFEKQMPVWTKYMVKVLGDKSLGYDENETFQLPEGYDPCKDDINLEGDTHIEEPIEGLDELFN